MNEELENKNIVKDPRVNTNKFQGLPHPFVKRPKAGTRFYIQNAAQTLLEKIKNELLA